MNPAELKPDLQPPAVMIESMLVDSREQKTNRLDSAWPPSITIPPGGEELEIHYTALNFSAPELVRFKCWLEGHETASKDVGDERVARYPKLPPGHYRFHVQACNEDNVWSAPDAAVLSITVQPQFWQTGWFRAAMILCLLGIVAAVVRYLSTQKLHRQLQTFQQREALEKERARIARDLHDQLGANLTQVALLGEMAEADKDAPAEIESHAQQISQTARETTRSLDEIVWAVNPANDTLDGLDQLRWQIRAGISRAGRTPLPRGFAGAVARDSDPAGSPPQRLPRVQRGRPQCGQARAGDRGADSIAPGA